MKTRATKPLKMAPTSDSDDNDSSTGGAVGTPKHKKTGATDTIVASSSGTYKTGDEVPEPSQPSEAHKAAKPSKHAKATKPAMPTTLANASPVKTPVASGKSTMGGGGSVHKCKTTGATDTIVDSSSGTYTAEDEVSEPSQPSEAHKADSQPRPPEPQLEDLPGPQDWPIHRLSRLLWHRAQSQRIPCCLCPMHRLPARMPSMNRRSKTRTKRRSFPL